MSKSFSFGSLNQTVTGAGAIVQAGENHAQSTVGSVNAAPTPEAIFEAILAELRKPTESPTEQAAREYVESQEPETLPEALSPSGALADSSHSMQGPATITATTEGYSDAPEESPEPPEAIVRQLQTLSGDACGGASETTFAKAAALYAKLGPVLPAVARGLATFGDAALTAVASSNPIVAGVLALCRSGKAS